MEFELEKPIVTDSAMIEVESARAIQEVQAAMIIAKRFPRDMDAAYVRIMKACERFSLAEQAEYAYPRGDTTVSGPSIRLAEVLAQNWGNMQFGIRELSQSGGESEVEAFAWDIETNTRQIKTFKVSHSRYTKKRGTVNLTDPRDIYEHVANQGARRMRACILGIIPGDIVEKALETCQKTVRQGIRARPLEDQIRATLKAFDALGVSTDLIEKRLGHETHLITEDELVELNNIGKSIKDNMTSRQDWFSLTPEVEPKSKPYKIENENGELIPDEKAEEKKTDNPVDDEAHRLFLSLRAAKPGRSKDALQRFKAVIEDKKNIALINLLDKDQQGEIIAKWKKNLPGELWPGVKSVQPDPYEGMSESEIFAAKMNVLKTKAIEARNPPAYFKVLAQFQAKNPDDIAPDKRDEVLELIEANLKGEANEPDEGDDNANEDKTYNHWIDFYTGELGTTAIQEECNIRQVKTPYDILGPDRQNMLGSLKARLDEKNAK